MKVLQLNQYPIVINYNNLICLLYISINNSSYMFMYYFKHVCLRQRYFIFFTVYTVKYTLYIVHCMYYFKHVSLRQRYYIFFTVYTVNYTLYNVHCMYYFKQFSLRQRYFIFFQKRIKYLLSYSRILYVVHYQ